MCDVHTTVCGHDTIVDSHHIIVDTTHLYAEACILARGKSACDSIGGGPVGVFLKSFDRSFIGG